MKKYNLVDFSIAYEMPIYDQLKAKLDSCKELDIEDVKTSFDIDEIPAELDYLETIYELYNEKLEFAKNIIKLDRASQQKYEEILTKIDYLDNISEKKQILMMISYGVLTSSFTKMVERTDEEIFMLASCTTKVDIDDYTFYAGILSDPVLAASIVEKTPNLKEQTKLALDIMDSQDEFPYDYITKDNYPILVKNGLDVVTNFSIAKSK